MWFARSKTLVTSLSLIALIALACLSPISTLSARQDSVPRQEGLSLDDLKMLLEQLESNEYRERQYASQQLSQANCQAVPMLVERMLNGPPETAATCARLLSQIALNSPEQEMTRIARVLMVLSEHGMGHLRDESIWLTRKWKQSRIDRTVRELQATGITVTPLGGFNEPMLFVNGATPPPLNGPEMPNQPRGSIDADLVMRKVDAIVAATEEENNEQFAAEMLSLEGEQPETSPSQTLSRGEVLLVEGGGRVVIRGDGLVELSGIHPGYSSGAPAFQVTIGNQFDGSARDLSNLALLPAISQLTIEDRSFDQDLIDLVRRLDRLQYVTLSRCTYDVAQVFELMQNRPGLSVTATGHEAFLGVQLQTDSLEDGATACRVLEVVAGSAAQAAGCQAGDIVRSINGVSITTFEQLILAIGCHKPGDSIKLDILRNGTEELQIEPVLRVRGADQ